LPSSAREEWTIRAPFSFSGWQYVRARGQIWALKTIGKYFLAFFTS
jgi:hypothetical protein